MRIDAWTFETTREESSCASSSEPRERIGAQRKCACLHVMTRVRRIRDTDEPRVYRGQEVELLRMQSVRIPTKSTHDGGGLTCWIAASHGSREGTRGALHPSPRKPLCRDVFCEQKRSFRLEQARRLCKHGLDVGHGAEHERHHDRIERMCIERQRVRRRVGEDGVRAPPRSKAIPSAFNQPQAGLHHDELRDCARIKRKIGASPKPNLDRSSMSRHEQFGAQRHDTSHRSFEQRARHRAIPCISECHRLQPCVRRKSRSTRTHLRV